MPVTLPLGYRPDIIVLNCDDPPLSLYTPEAMPWFMANKASSSLWYPNASANGPLCLPGRISVLTGQRMEHHRGYDNGSGANLRLGETLFAAMKHVGYRTAAIGKGINGWGETGSGGFGSPGMLFPGTDFQRLMYGPPNYFDYDLCNEKGQLTAYGSAAADYAVDVELSHITTFINSTPASQPVFLYWASKAPHQDTGGSPIPAPRHASLSINVPHSPSFGLNPASYGNPPWMVKAAQSPWDQATIDDLTNRHREALRTLRSLDEALQGVFALLAATGRTNRTVIFIMGDNAHAFGEMRLDDKGTCHRSSSSKLLRVIAPGVAGGTRYQAVSDIDIAPTCCHLGGAYLPVSPDGMSMWPTVTDAAAVFRQAAPIGSLVKDSPTQAGLWFGPEAGRAQGGRVYYEGLPGGKAAGEVGCWTDFDQTTDQGPQPDAALALSVLRGAVYPRA